MSSGLPASALPTLGQCLIGGTWSAGVGPVTRTLLSPCDTRETVASVPEASLEQVDAACAAAAKAFPSWRGTPAPERARLMFKFRELLEANYLDLAKLIVAENGKLLGEAKGDVRRGIDVVEFACGVPSHMMGSTLPEISHNVDSYFIREPIGVVAGVPPFNCACAHCISLPHARQLARAPCAACTTPADGSTPV